MKTVDRNAFLIRPGVIVTGFLPRLFAGFAAVMFWVLAAGPARAATEQLPAGSYVIPMDNSLQGNFNMRAYGLAVRLLHGNVPLKWVINPTKGKDGVDFTANASRIKPSAGAAQTYSFRAGPLVVYPGFESQALPIINSYGNNVAVYQLNSAVTVNVDSNLLHKPKVAVFNQGGNADIHTFVLSNAGLTRGTHYQVVNNASNIGAGSCFTVATEPHAKVSSVSASAASALLNFLRSGGNFFGQCEAVEAYTRRGLLANFQSKGDLNGSMRFDNHSDPMAQFQGGLTDEGGSVESFKLTSNPGKRIAYSSNDGSRYKAYVGRVTGVNTPNGGWVHYLAGHKYNDGGIGQINGRRMLMNAVLRSADRPDVCGLSLSSDLAVTKVVNNSTPFVGDNVTFTIAATNNGPLNATGVVVNDLLPSGLTYVSHSAPIGTYTPATGVWSIGALDNGVTRTLSITATVTAAAIPSRINTATVSGEQGDGNTSNNTASATVSPLFTNLGVTKTVNNPAPTVGDQVVFTITASNLGNANATGVVVNDLLPSGLSYVSHTASAGLYNAGTGVWSIGSLANGASRTLTLTATVTTAALPNVINAATVTGNEFDPNLGNNTATSTVTPVTSDLAVTKEVDNGSQDIGGNVVFTITASNNGPAANSGVVVSDPLPVGLDYVSHTPSIGSYSPGSGLWSIGSLASGASATLTITATVNPAAVPSAVNTATITGSVYDPNPSNNTASVTVSPALAADLSIVKVASDPEPPLGGQVTFTLTAGNSGPLDATGVVVNDLLPAGLAYVSHSESVGSYNPVTGAWAIGNLAIGAAPTLTITATVGSAAVPTVTNLATISGLEADPNPGNNASTATVAPNVSTDLLVTKAVDLDNPVVGQIVTFTITATNNGPSDATGVIVNDLLPSGLEYLSHTTSFGTFVPSTGFWAIGNLANGASQTLTITARTNLDAGPSVTNTASISGIEPDPDPNNNHDDRTINILNGADVSIVKTVNNSTPFVGETVVFTLTVSNAGPQDATGVIVTDVLPAGFSNPSNISNGGEFAGDTITWPAIDVANGGTATFTFEAVVSNP